MLSQASGEELGASGGVDDDRFLRAVVAAIRYLECHSDWVFYHFGDEVARGSKQVAGSRFGFGGNHAWRQSLTLEGF